MLGPANNSCSCEIGYYGEMTETFHCVKCPSGWFGNKPPTSFCQQCVSGKSSSSSATDCETCAKGKYSPSAGSVCLDCQKGFFQPQDQIASVECMGCPFGYTQVETGQSFCNDLGYKKASDCTKNQYLNDTDAINANCVDCPIGASCEGSINASGILPLFGWSRCPNHPLNFTECAYSPACLGAPNPVLQNKFVNQTGVDLALVVHSTESCAHDLGHQNPSRSNLRCSTCRLGYVRVIETGECKKCGGNGAETALIVVAVVVVVVIFVVMIALKMRSSGSKKAEHSTIKRTLLTHLQMITIVMSLTVPWPEAVRAVLKFVSGLTSVSAQSSSLHCRANNGKGIYYGILLFSVLLPIFMMVLTFLYWFVLAPRSRVLSCGKELHESSWCPTRNPFSSSNGRNAIDTTAHETTPATTNTTTTTVRRRSTRDGWIVTNVLVLYIFNPSIVRLSLQMLQKKTICGIEYWSSDDTVVYNSNIHQTWIMTVVLPSLLLYGVVCVVLAVLYLGRHPDRRTNSKLMFRFGLLYSGFAEKYWWYELILYFRKVAIILIVTLASSNGLQLHYAMGTLIVFLFIQEQIRPFENSDIESPQEKKMNTRLHNIETCSMLVLISMVWTAVIFVIGCDDESYVCSVLGIGVLSGNLFFSILCMAVFLKAFEKKHHVVEKMRMFRLSSLKDGARNNTTVVIDQDTVGSWTSAMGEGVVYVNPCCPAASEVEMVAVSGLSSSASRSSSSSSPSSSSSKKTDDEFD